MNWEKAVKNIETLIPLYEEIGWTGSFGLSILRGYMHRYDEGERTQELYESMMSAE